MAEPPSYWTSGYMTHASLASMVFAVLLRTIRQDIEAVGYAVLEPWSNGQTEGQINKLKTLKRAMYGRAGIDLLRARMCHSTKRICTES